MPSVRVERSESKFLLGPGEMDRGVRSAGMKLNKQSQGCSPRLSPHAIMLAASFTRRKLTWLDTPDSAPPPPHGTGMTQRGGGGSFVAQDVHVRLQNKRPAFRRSSFKRDPFPASLHLLGFRLLPLLQCPTLPVDTVPATQPLGFLRNTDRC
ncbi:hypothetical protein GN956_G19626 [Arapaima gigas]